MNQKYMRPFWYCTRYRLLTFHDNLNDIHSGVFRVFEIINESKNTNVFNAEVEAQLFLENGVFYMLLNERLEETIKVDNVMNVSRLIDVGVLCKRLIKEYFASRNAHQLKTLTELLKSKHGEEYANTLSQKLLLHRAGLLIDLAEHIASEHRRVLEEKIEGDLFAKVA